MTLARGLVARGDDVLLTGGEPFFPKFGFAKILNELVESYDRKSLGRFDIQTNGTYLDESVRGLLLRAPVSVVGISMDTLRPELFDYLRRGSRFEQVWDNARALVRERDAAGLREPEVKVLCAVMKANYDHLGETIDRVVTEGMGISLNILFKAYFSPIFQASSPCRTSLSISDCCTWPMILKEFTSAMATTDR
jgi:MoaA/NifB/PqqE/SkfB family radical SAM enzyme